MAEYISLYLFIAFMALLTKLSKGSLIEKNSKLVYIIFGAITLIIGLRHSNMGNDLPGYVNIFHLCGIYSFEDMASFRGNLIADVEIGYLLLNKLISFFTDNENIFLLIVAGLSILPSAYVVNKRDVNVFFAALIFMALPSFAMQFSGLRQVIAMSICFLSILCIQKKQLWGFVVIVLFAATFHQSALIYLLCYPAYWFKVSRNKRFGLLFLLLIIFIFRRYLFVLIFSFIDESYQEVVETGSIGILMFTIMNYVITVLFSDNEDVEINGYLNILYIGMIASCFISINNMALRIAEYYINVLVLLIPKMISKIQIKNNSYIIKYAYIVLMVFMGIMYLYNGGSSWSRSYPYYWFWEDMQYTKWYL